VTQAEIDTVIQNARKQGIDLTQITIFYGGTDSAPSQRGFFSPDGMPLASNGEPLSPSEITNFYYLAAD
jgi:hypothetical protein